MKIIKFILLIIPFHAISMEWQPCAGPYNEHEKIASTENKIAQPPLHRVVPALQNLCFQKISANIAGTIEKTISKDILEEIKKKLPETLHNDLVKAYLQSYGWKPNAVQDFTTIFESTDRIYYSPCKTFLIAQKMTDSSITIIDLLHKKKIHLEQIVNYALSKLPYVITHSVENNRHDLALYSQTSLYDKKPWEKHIFYQTNEKPRIIQPSDNGKFIAVANKNNANFFSFSEKLKIVYSYKIPTNESIELIGFGSNTNNPFILSRKKKTDEYSIYFCSPTTQNANQKIFSFVEEESDYSCANLEISPLENCIIIPYLNAHRPKILVKTNNTWKELTRSFSPNDDDDNAAYLSHNGTFLVYSEYENNDKWPTYIYWPETDTKKYLLTLDGCIESDEITIADDSSYVIIKKHQFAADKTDVWIPYKCAAINNWEPQKLAEEHNELIAWFHVPEKEILYGITPDLKCLILNSEPWESHIPVKGNIQFFPTSNIVFYEDQQNLYIFSARSGSLLNTIKKGDKSIVQKLDNGIYLIGQADLRGVYILTFLRGAWSVDEIISNLKNGDHYPHIQ